MVEDTFGFVRVRGEVSQPNVNSGSGHCYLKLKDDKAVLEAVCWKGTMAKLAHKPQAGMEVIATGKLTTYPGSSRYQLVIESLEPAGIGALMAMLEARKKALEAEGLFAAARKQPIPFLPTTIGIVTSPTGAVIRDILHRLADRFPRHVLLWPVPVQGAAAAEKIADAIRGFNAFESVRHAGPPSTGVETHDANAHAPHQSILRPDVIIVARGGGSIEDLWAFNEEVVVRAVAESRIPVISAVGHETDTTLIDYAADKRAPTPTAAAEMAVPVRSELRVQLEQLHAAHGRAMDKLLRQHGERIEGLARGLPRPQQLVASMAQALDMLAERLDAALPRSLQLRAERLERLTVLLSPRFLREMIAREERQLAHFAAMLESLNVLNVLKRGFVLVKDAGGQVVQSAAVAAKQASLTLQFHDGVQVVSTGEGNAAPKPRSKKPAEQPTLFD